MKNFLFVFILLKAITGNAFGQSFTVHDLVNLANMKPADISNYMYKKNYVHDIDAEANDSSITSYIQKMRGRRALVDTFKSVDLYQKKSIRYFVMHTSSAAEYSEGRQWLPKEKFVYDTKKDLAKSPVIIFEKANVVIESLHSQKDSFTIYTFTLKEKKAPDSVIYAEDLLQFTSKEYLTSYFGKNNVTDDLYYISDKQTKKCSVLMAGTPHQAAFIWEDENNCDSLAYIMLSNELPTKAGKEKGEVEGSTSNWKYRCGIRWGMTLKDMLRLNQMDFSIYGNKSDYYMMVKPETTGNINFTKMGIMMNCSDCESNEIFNQDELSALEAAKAQLPLKVVDIILYP